MPRIKTRTFSGAVCEQEVFFVSERVKDIKEAQPRQRFRTEEEREQHRLGISRRKHARLINENFSPRSLYSTLTFDNESEVHTFDEARRIRNNFVRRLQYRAPDVKIVIYMGRGKNTSRIHFHMLTDGIGEEIIREQWKCGSVLRIENLRAHNYYDGIDHGQDYTGLANYLIDHWTPEQGGHRWKQTSNLDKPERETPTLVRRVYTEAKPPRAPRGYILVETRSNQFGYFYFKYIKKPEKRSRHKKC